MLTVEGHWKETGHVDRLHLRICNYERHGLIIIVCI